MNKVVFLSVIFMGYVLIAEAQESTAHKILKRFEVVGGPSFSKNTGYLVNYESKYGYSLGLGYYQPVTKWFSLNLRALHETKGSATTYSYSVGYPDNTEYVVALPFVSWR